MFILREVKRARKSAGCPDWWTIVKNDCDTWIGAERFTADTGGKANILQVNGFGAYGTDGIQAEIDRTSMAVACQLLPGVVDAGRRFTGDHPDPGCISRLLEQIRNVRNIEAFSPLLPVCDMVKPPAMRMINQTITEFTVTQYQAAAWQGAEPGCDRVVGTGARTGPQIDLFRLRQCLKLAC